MMRPVRCPPIATSKKTFDVTFGGGAAGPKTPPMSFNGVGTEAD
eukprot:CAMPEP_0197630876 /NCGR_PEP_ID=MMETSP1338-20131121/8228_1 /TAXON_ID=43686 ORGANISM="Pelagodinium beii, Strain RCC1491" /NCGR_SAMPLE_ID=MMETSP1338 /ASSEMBLY_ACC=CAM_ASM_000754 /LENGTH=43 /DNA_ID= /DNA_START= /DNA_END= /DNA_ORIENTATION=